MGAPAGRTAACFLRGVVLAAVELVDLRGGGKMERSGGAGGICWRDCCNCCAPRTDDHCGEVTDDRGKLERGSTAADAAALEDGSSPGRARGGADTARPFLPPPLLPPSLFSALADLLSSSEEDDELA